MIQDQKGSERTIPAYGCLGLEGVFVLVGKDFELNAYVASSNPTIAAKCVCILGHISTQRQMADRKIEGRDGRGFGWQHQSQFHRNFHFT